MRAMAVVKKLREEWREVAGGSSLIDTYASIGLVLVDLVVGLGLTKAEMIDCLGIEFYLEVQHIIEDIAEPSFDM